jgi:uncharacterized protein (DUF1697 family)
MSKKTTYIALLRGIGPGNPNMRNDKLRSAFEALGYENVRSVISSGNIIFETFEADSTKLEADIEAGLLSQLGIHSPAIVRTKEAMQKFLARRPFGDRMHGNDSYLMVTFLKDKAALFDASLLASDKGVEVIDFDKDIQAICYIIDIHSSKVTNAMNRLERFYNKATTGRTWKTIERIVAKL